MKFCKISRTDFASLLTEMPAGSSSPPGVRLGQPDSPPEPHSVLACWNDESPRDDSLPMLGVVADQDLNDFLAWAVTFLPAFRPLTSFVRILPWSIFSMVQVLRQGWDSELNCVLIGAILGETMTNATGRGFIESLPLTAYESTYSFAISRALLVGLNRKVLQEVSNGWNDVREFTEQPTRKMPPEALENIWSVVLRLTRENGALAANTTSDDRIGLLEEACREIHSGEGVSSFNWHRLSGNRISNSVIADSMKSTKEHRVETFEEAVKTLSRNVPDELHASFLVGYLASLVSDGSLEHGHLISPLQDRLPTAMLWYGICAGLLPKNRILTDHNHLGLKILRLLKRNDGLVSPPTCDVSLAELEIMLRGNSPAKGFRQTHASFLRVELVPMVTTVLRWPGRPAAGGGQLGLFGGDDRQPPVEADRLRELITSLRGSLSLAESLLGSKPPSGETPYPSRGKRRR